MNLFVRTITHVWSAGKEMFSTSKFFRWCMISSFLIVLLMIGLPIWKLSPAGATEREFIPLHYNVYFGTDQFGIWYQVFVLPAIGASLLIINTLFQAVFYHREHVLSYFFALTTVLAEVALLASLIFIVLLNI